MKILSHLFIIISVFLLAFFSQISEIYMSLVSNIFFFGKSNTKLLSYLIYLGAFVFYAFISTTRFKLQMKIATKHIWALLLVVSMLSVGSYVFFAARYNLDTRGGSVFISDGLFEDFLQIAHIHTLKPTLTWPLTLFGVSNVPHVGDGIIFFEYMPVFYVFGSVFVYALLILLTLKGVELINNRKYSLGFIILYSLLAFGVFKSLLDGGPFSTEFVISLVFYYVFININSYEDRVKAIIKNPLIILLSLTVVYFVYQYFYIGNTDIISTLISYIQFYSEFLILTALMLFQISGKKLRIISFLVLFCGLLLQLDCPTIKTMAYAYKQIPEGFQVVLADEKFLPYPVLYKGPTVNSYITVSAKNENFLDYILRNELNLQYYPINVAGMTCTLAPSVAYSVEVAVLQGIPQIGVRNGDMTDFMAYSTLSYLHDNHYILEIQPRGCFSDARYMISQELFVRNVTRGLVVGQRKVVSDVNTR